MEYWQRLFIYNARRHIIEILRLSGPKSSRNLSSDWLEANIKAMRSKCCKVFKKLTSISKNTSIAKIEEGSRDLRLPSMTIGKSSLIRSVCERPRDGYLVALIGSVVHSIVTYLLSENSVDSNSHCCASAVVTKSTQFV